MVFFRHIVNLRTIIVTFISLAILSCEEFASEFVEPNLNFKGISSADFVGADKLVISWEPLTVSGAGSIDVTYELFVYPTDFDDANSSLDASDANFSGDPFVLEYLDDTPPLRSDEIVVDATKGNNISLKWDKKIYDAKKTYYVYVRAFEAESQRVILPARAVIFGVADYKPIFDGLQEEELTIVETDDGKAFQLEWEPAKGTVGKVEYLIYTDDKWANYYTTTPETKYIFRNPIPGKIYYFGVRARDERGSDDNRSLQDRFIPDDSDRDPPKFDGVKSVKAVSHQSILVEWSPSPSSDISRYYVYFADNLNSDIGSTVETNIIIEGLQRDTEYPFIVRAEDTNGNKDLNKVIMSAKTLPYEVPLFNGVSRVKVKEGVLGLSQIEVLWQNAVFNPSRGADIEGYMVFWSKYSEQIDYDLPGYVINDPAANSFVVKNLAEGQRYRFAVRAFYQDLDSDYESEFNENEKTAATVERIPPTFGGISRVVQASTENGLGVVDLFWKSPNTDGIWSGFIVAYGQGLCASSSNGDDAENAFYVAGAETKNAQVSGLELGKVYGFRVFAYLPSSGQNDALKDQNSVCIEFMPEVIPPAFAGATEIFKNGDARDFSSFEVKWEAPTGDCSFIDVSLSNNELDPAFGAELCSDLVSAPCRVELICSDTSYEFVDLTENTTYFVQARARFTSPNGQNLTSGEGIEISTVTNLERPEGDKIIGATIIPVTGGLDQIQVSWDLPTSEKGWNNIFVWRSEASTESAARNAVISMANSAGPSDHFAYDAFSRNNDWANTLTQQTYDAVLGVHNCFLVRAAYSDGTYYSDSDNDHVLCAKPLFTPPDFQGISQVTYLPEKYSTNDPGYGWLQVDFMNTPSGTIDRYALFFSESQDISTFDFNNPLAKVNYGHLDCTVSCDLVINDNTILVRLPITTILAGNYLVRWETEGSSISDTNVKIAYFSGNEGPPLSDDTVKWLSVGATAEIGFDPAFVGGLSGLIVVRGNELLNGQVAGEIEQFPLGDTNVEECAGAPTSSCLWSHESLDKWEPRYYQLTAFDDASGQIRKSRVFGHARVPAGMVYIDKELWPDSTGFHYSSWERYSFAMDKYEVSLASGTLLNGGEYVNEGNGVLVSSPTGLPIPLSTQSLKKGCFNRSTTAESSLIGSQLLALALPKDSGVRN